MMAKKEKNRTTGIPRKYRKGCWFNSNDKGNDGHGYWRRVSSCGSSSAESPNQMNLNTQPMSIGTYNSPKSARPGDWPANSGAGKSVVILGAGIAGMTSAFELQKLGYSVSILEATNRAGGRNITIRSGDVVNELTSSQTCNFDVNGELYFNPGPRE